MDANKTAVVLDQSQLLAYIEFLRNELIKIGLANGLNDEKTLNASKELDYFIYEYQKAIYN
jgi:hypothetical protein